MRNIRMRVGGASWSPLSRAPPCARSTPPNSHSDAYVPRVCAHRDTVSTQRARTCTHTLLRAARSTLCVTPVDNPGPTTSRTTHRSLGARSRSNARAHPSRPATRLAVCLRSSDSSCKRRRPEGQPLLPEHLAPRPRASAERIAHSKGAKSFICEWPQRCARARLARAGSSRGSAQSTSPNAYGRCLRDRAAAQPCASTATSARPG